MSSSGDGVVTLVTWNVNSLKVRLPQLVEWLAAESPDVVCLQETKLEDSRFPVADIEAAGYRVAFSGQKTYNGVAILARTDITDVGVGIPGFADEQKRVIAATVGGIRVICAYVPNGQSVESDKYRYKLDWLAALNRWLPDELSRHPSLAILGDYNIAPADADVHDPAVWAGQVLCTDAERAAFRAIEGHGLVDSFRLFEQPAGSYSWWDYRMNAFRRKMGLRIDHILVSAPLAARCVASRIDIDARRAERPSDHAPVLTQLGP